MSGRWKPSFAPLLAAPWMLVCACSLLFESTPEDNQAIDSGLPAIDASSDGPGSDGPVDARSDVPTAWVPESFGQGQTLLEGVGFTYQLPPDTSFNPTTRPIPLVIEGLLPGDTFVMNLPVALPNWRICDVEVTAQFILSDATLSSGCIQLENLVALTVAIPVAEGLEGAITPLRIDVTRDGEVMPVFVPVRALPESIGVVPTDPGPYSGVVIDTGNTPNRAGGAIVVNATSWIEVSHQIDATGTVQLAGPGSSGAGGDRFCATPPCNGTAVVSGANGGAGVDCGTGASGANGGGASNASTGMLGVDAPACGGSGGNAGVLASLSPYLVDLSASGGSGGGAGGKLDSSAGGSGGGGGGVVVLHSLGSMLLDNVFGTSILVSGGDGELSESNGGCGGGGAGGGILLRANELRPTGSFDFLEYLDYQGGSCDGGALSEGGQGQVRIDDNLFLDPIVGINNGTQRGPVTDLYENPQPIVLTQMFTFQLKGHSARSGGEVQMAHRHVSSGAYSLQVLPHVTATAEITLFLEAGLNEVCVVVRPMLATTVPAADMRTENLVCHWVAAAF